MHPFSYRDEPIRRVVAREERVAHITALMGGVVSCCLVMVLSRNAQPFFYPTPDDGPVPEEMTRLRAWSFSLSPLIERD